MYCYVMVLYMFKKAYRGEPVIKELLTVNITYKKFLMMSHRALHSNHFLATGVKRLTEPHTQLDTVWIMAHLDVLVFSLSVLARETLSVCQSTDRASESECMSSGTCFVTCSSHTHTNATQSLGMKWSPLAFVYIVWAIALTHLLQRLNLAQTKFWACVSLLHLTLASLNSYMHHRHSCF